MSSAYMGTGHSVLLNWTLAGPNPKWLRGHILTLLLHRSGSTISGTRHLRVATKTL
jgi:hypothetical protein